MKGKGPKGKNKKNKLKKKVTREKLKGKGEANYRYSGGPYGENIMRCAIHVRPGKQKIYEILRGK